ncbi:MAG: AAA family ATPase [Gammaproteobacteria bacterium]|nr:AAA family ATPase [Gammaproteobacteria bacterium]
MPVAEERALLVVLGGLPGAGKSTLANALAERLGVMHLRIDTIEQAMRDAGQTVAGPEGYLVAREVARANLRLGLPVIIDAVNPIAYTRKLWQEMSAATGARLVEIELVCGDSAEHRHRVESRTVDIDGLRLPTWQDVLEREYEPWTTAHAIDTGGRSVDDCLEAIVARLPSRLA